MPDAQSLKTINKHKLVYVICLILSSAVFLGETFLGLFFKLHCLVSDASSNLVDTIMYAVSIWAVSQTLKHQRRTTYFICLIQFVIGMFSLSFFVVGVVEVSHSNPDWMIMIISSSVSFVVSLVQSIIIYRTEHKGSVGKTNAIFTYIGLLSAFCGILSGIVIMFLMKSPHVTHDWYDTPDLVVSLVFSSLIIFQSIKIFVDIKRNKKVDIIQ